jgi:hypothetical protein
MDPQSSKLQHRQVAETTEQTSGQQHQLETHAALEFGSVEEMLRHDARENPPPPELEQRVAASVAELPPPARSWWRRWFSKD